MDRKISRRNSIGAKALVIISAVLIALVSYGFVFTGTASVLKVNDERLTYSRVKLEEFQEYLPVDGIVTPGETIYLDVIQGGVVEKVYVEDGTTVSKGDTLIRLYNADLELEYMMRETQMLDIMNNLQTSKSALSKIYIELQRKLTEVNYKVDILKKKAEMNNELLKSSGLSKMDCELTQKEYEYQVRVRQFMLAEAAIDSTSIARQEKMLNKSIARMYDNLNAIHKIPGQFYITAPISGQLSALSAVTGELKKMGDKAGQIDAQEYYKIQVNMDEHYVGRVYTGQAATVAYLGMSYALKVTKILPEVKDGTFRVDMAFIGAQPEGIKRGQSLPVHMEFSVPSKTLVIDKGAFYPYTGGSWIYVVDEKRNTAERRKIRIGRQNDDSYEVLSGLEAGERVIVSSYRDFNDKEQLILNH